MSGANIREDWAACYERACRTFGATEAALKALRLTLDTSVSLEETYSILTDLPVLRLRIGPRRFRGRRRGSLTKFGHEGIVDEAEALRLIEETVREIDKRERSNTLSRCRTSAMKSVGMRRTAGGWE